MMNPKLKRCLPGGIWPKFPQECRVLVGIQREVVFAGGPASREIARGAARAAWESGLVEELYPLEVDDISSRPGETESFGKSDRVFPTEQSAMLFW